MFVLRYRFGVPAPPPGNQAEAVAQPKTSWLVFLLQACFAVVFVAIYVIALKSWRDNPIVEKSTGASCSAPQGKQLLGIYGNMSHQYHRAIRCDGDATQRLFDQGMVHLFGYNRVEARRNFEAALLLDPQCFMCYWGLAHSETPTVNEPMKPENHVNGRKDLTKALLLAEKNMNSTNDSKELSMIQALASAFAENENELKANGQSFFDEQHVEALRQLHQMYPLDDDIASLYAHSIMLLSPWKYYVPRRNINVSRKIPKDLLESMKPAWTALSSVVQRNSRHPLALHLFIHIVEPSDDVSLAEGAADALFDLVRGSGSSHLVHMPSHIYFRLGRHVDGIESSKLSVALDASYQTHCLVPYLPGHNLAMLISSALASGRLRLALEFAPQISLDMPDMAGSFLTGIFPAPREFVWSRFGQWNELLNSQRDIHNVDSRPTYLQTVYWYGQCLALIRMNQETSAEAALTHLIQASQSIPESSLNKEHPFYPKLQEMGRMMVHIATAAWLSRPYLDTIKYGEVLAELESALVFEDAFLYIEPESFYLPVRQCLAAAYWSAAMFHLEVDHSAPMFVRYLQLAEETYLDDLKHHPKNGWSLKGLETILKTKNSHGFILQNSTQSVSRHLRHLEATKEAALLEITRIQLQAWRAADWPIKGSCCELGHC